MRVAVIGCGRQGAVIANKLLEYGYEVTAVDVNAGNLRKFKGRDKLLLDVKDTDRLKQFLKGYEFAVDAVPARLGLHVMQAAIEAGTNLVDISFTEGEVLDLQAATLSAGITIIPDCGVAPGLSNIFAGNACVRLAGVHTIKIYVGGVPVDCEAYNLCVNFCPEDMLEEYKRPVRIKVDGKIKQVAPLSGLEEIEFTTGEYECFYTDGLRTMLQTLDVRNLSEKTVRCKGHVGWIKTMSEDELLQVLRRYASMDIEDVVVLRVLGIGVDKTIVYSMVDFYDKQQGITAMARTTGYTAAIVAKLLIDGEIQMKGVVPPERLGMDEHLFDTLLRELSRCGIDVNIEVMG